MDVVAMAFLVVQAIRDSTVRTNCQIADNPKQYPNKAAAIGAFTARLRNELHHLQVHDKISQELRIGLYALETSKMWYDIGILNTGSFTELATRTYRPVLRDSEERLRFLNAFFTYLPESHLSSPVSQTLKVQLPDMSPTPKTPLPLPELAPYSKTLRELDEDVLRLRVLIQDMAMLNVKGDGILGTLAALVDKHQLPVK